MSEFLTPTALPAQEGGQSLQNRLRELRSRLEPGDKADEPAKMMTTATVELTPEEWNVLLALKEEE